MTPEHDSGGAGQLKPGFHTPSRTSTVGMYLFLASLSMLFAAGMLGYVMVRLKAAEKAPLGVVHLPGTLWISTVLVITASFTIHFAVHYLRRERLSSFRLWLTTTLLLAIAFVIVQAPSLAAVLARHREDRRHHLALYGLIFFLILLHAAHVIGGIAALSWTRYHAAQNRYDHEHYQPVRHVALYWHFLDLVWLVMFFTFLGMK